MSAHRMFRAGRRAYRGGARAKQQARQQARQQQAGAQQQAGGQETPGLLQRLGDSQPGLKVMSGAFGSGAALGTIAYDRIKRKIENEPRRRAILEDLSTNDPIISEADPEKVLQYYATIYNFAPEIALDKNTVQELLHHFIRFGRIDLQTLKTLAETEKTIEANKDRQSTVGAVRGVLGHG